MIPPTSTQPGAKRSDQRGQISIFFASSLIVLISIIAFIINIGLFVKAKINLQNAVDASAYAGAAVQARMLNRIGYLNWEMRNNYKEWMFKYYVLGNLNINEVANPSLATDNIHYTMEPDPNVTDPSFQSKDAYNFPSVCLHYSGIATNVCKKYAIAGVPRFEPTNLVGIDETTSTFIDAIVTAKSSDCSKRSKLNYAVTSMWAYNVETGGGQAFADAPQIAIDRQGAWPKGVELAIRVRSLELAVNLPPVRGLCKYPGQAAGACASQADTLNASNPHYGNERPAKAFWSGYRNLGNQADSEMKNSFTLTELAPTPVNYSNPLDLSLLFTKNLPKYYLDLKLMPVNYATFFTALIARSDLIKDPSGGTLVTTEGACDVSKIAIPVPGFPLGYYKNPDVLTYYAVKGEANFQGLFNPFAGGGVKLTAWAAAKPMGGRIGPALFEGNNSGGTTLELLPRKNTANYRSLPYISGLDLAHVKKKGGNTEVPVGTYTPGMPLPINGTSDPDTRFWINKTSDQVGGNVSGPAVVFGIPNMVFDFENNDITSVRYSTGTSGDTNIIRPANSDVTAYASGLYKKYQLNKLKMALTNGSTPQGITDAINRVRAPTTYEAANYTIPTPFDQQFSTAIDGGYADTFGFIAGPPRGGDVSLRSVDFYAPVYGSTGDAAFSTSDAVGDALETYIKFQEDAMKKFRNSMNQVAFQMYSENPSKYEKAAKQISDYDFTSTTPTNGKPSCASITGSLLSLFLGNGNNLTSGAGTCPTSLKENIKTYWHTPTGGTFHPQIYHMEYSLTDTAGSTVPFQRLLTGYMPGPLRGANIRGQAANPFAGGGGGDFETMRRTGYSTKFITLKSLTNSGHGYGPGSGFAIYSEGASRIVPDIGGGALKNPLDLSSAGVPSTLNH